MRQLEIENELRDVVSRIINQVDLSTKQGRLDINLSLEDALIPILKAAYNLPNLINLNRRQKNFPASIWVMTMTVSPFRLPPPLLWKRSKRP
ncbi:SMEK domain-containing protein [Pseudomonas aeruginosa]|nr:SMEK domain-containing protein [Pseudomonas aeruginosa]